LRGQSRNDGNPAKGVSCDFPGVIPLVFPAPSSASTGCHFFV
jgi:hypothetical protein